MNIKKVYKYLKVYNSLIDNVTFTINCIVNNVSV